MNVVNKLLIFLMVITGIALQTDALDSIWTGNGDTPNWSNTDNWRDKQTPSVNENLVFDGNKGLENTNDLIPNITFSSIVFEQDAAAFVLGGNAINISNSIENYANTLQTINLP